MARSARHDRLLAEPVWRVAAPLPFTSTGETTVTVVLLALAMGIVAGLRAFTAPAAVSWAAHHGWLHFDGSWLAFLGYSWAPWILTALALVELVTDQLPSTPSRKCRCSSAFAS